MIMIIFVEAEFYGFQRMSVYTVVYFKFYKAHFECICCPSAVAKLLV